MKLEQGLKENEARQDICRDQRMRCVVRTAPWGPRIFFQRSAHRRSCQDAKQHGSLFFVWLSCLCALKLQDKNNTQLIKGHNSVTSHSRISSWWITTSRMKWFLKTNVPLLSVWHMVYIHPHAKLYVHQLCAMGELMISFDSDPNESPHISGSVRDYLLVCTASIYMDPFIGCDSQFTELAMNGTDAMWWNLCFSSSCIVPLSCHKCCTCWFSQSVLQPWSHQHHIYFFVILLFFFLFHFPVVGCIFVFLFLSHVLYYTVQYPRDKITHSNLHVYTRKELRSDMAWRWKPLW